MCRQGGGLYLLYFLGFGDNKAVNQATNTAGTRFFVVRNCWEQCCDASICSTPSTACNIYVHVSVISH